MIKTHLMMCYQTLALMNYTVHYVVVLVLVTVAVAVVTIGLHLHNFCLVADTVERNVNELFCRLVYEAKKPLLKWTNEPGKVRNSMSKKGGRKKESKRKRLTLVVVAVVFPR